MKAYCPNCDRYMAAVREKDKTTYFTCHPCNRRLWLDLPETEEAPVSKPANALVILEASAQDVLVIATKEEWDSGTQVFIAIASLWSLFVGLVNCYAIANDLSYSWIYLLPNILTLVFWTSLHAQLYRYQLLYFDKEEIVVETCVGRKRSITSRRFADFLGVSLVTSEFDSKSIVGVCIRMKAGKSFTFSGYMSPVELRWLARALRQTPLLRERD